MDAALRLRSGSSGASVLGGRAAHQDRSTGALFPRRRRWRIALQLSARQPAAVVDAPAALLRLSVAFAGTGAAAAQTAPRPASRAAKQLAVQSISQSTARLSLR